MKMHIPTFQPQLLKFFHRKAVYIKYAENTISVASLFHHNSVREPRTAHDLQNLLNNVF